MSFYLNIVCRNIVCDVGLKCWWNWHLKKDLIVAIDNCIDGLKDFVIGLGIDVDTMAVLWLVRRGHEDLKDADVVMQQMGKCKWKWNLRPYF